MSVIEGRAKKFDGTAIDYVSIFNWADGKCIAQVLPDESGSWEYEYFDNLNVGITYVANGCEPITHGAYSKVGMPSPAIFFKKNEKGSWYDIKDASTLFKDVLGTMPVTEDNDRVALVLDKSGNGNHLIQEASSRRPVYKYNNGVPKLTFDGVQQILVSINSFDLSKGDITYFTAYSSPLSAMVPVTSIAGPPNQGINISADSFHTRPVINTAENGVSFKYARSTAIRVVGITLNKNTRLYSGYVDGLLAGSVSVPTTAWYNSPSFIVVGANRYHPNIPSFNKIDFYGAVLLQSLASDDDRVKVEQYLAHRSGAILT